MNSPVVGRAVVFYGWWLVGAGFLLQGIAAAAVSYSYGLVIAPLAEEFSASRLEMMLGITAATLGAGLFAPFLGVAIDRYPLRLLACIGVTMLGCGFLWLSFASAMWHAIAAYALCMSIAGLLMGSTLVSSMLARWFRRRLGLAMGIAAIGTSACGFVLPPLLQWGIDGWGWREAFRFFAVADMVVMLPLTWLLLEDSPAQRGLVPDGVEPDPVAGAQSQQVPLASSTAEVMRQRNFWLVALVVGVLFSLYSALLSNIAPLATGRGVSGETAALLISTLAVFGMIGKVAFGVLADRIDLRAGLGAALILMILSLILLIHADSHLMLFVAGVLLGLAAGGMLPVWGALMAVLFGTVSYGRVMGLMNPIMMPIILLGAPFAGWSYDLHGNYAQAFWVFVGLCLLTLVAVAQIRLPAQVRA